MDDENGAFYGPESDGEDLEDGEEEKKEIDIDGI